MATREPIDEYNEAVTAVLEWRDVEMRKMIAALTKEGDWVRGRKKINREYETKLATIEALWACENEPAYKK